MTLRKAIKATWVAAYISWDLWRTHRRKTRTRAKQLQHEEGFFRVMFR